MRVRTRIILSVVIGLVATVGSAWVQAATMNKAQRSELYVVMRVSILGGDRSAECSPAFGWPLDALSCKYSMNKNGHVLVDRGLVIRDTGVSTVQPALPTLPLWSGVFADSAIYALFAWFVLTFAADLRRSIRRHRGRCIHCGYRVAKGTCPECGSEVTR